MSAQVFHRCPKCVILNQSSTFREIGTVATAVFDAPVFDEKGRRHVHDSNTYTTSYECSAGHRWESSKKRACWCGWPRNRQPVPVLAPVISETRLLVDRPVEATPTTSEIIEVTPPPSETKPLRSGFVQLTRKQRRELHRLEEEKNVPEEKKDA